MKTAGFSLLELLVIMGASAILFGIGVMSLNNIQNRTYVNTAALTFLADIKEQQLKAMMGDTEGTGTIMDYGIRFEATGYILFRGSTYSAADTTNYVVNLDNNMQLTTTLPQAQIIFTKGSGEINGLTTGANTITLRNTLSGSQKVVTVNKFGAVVSVN